MGWTFLHLQIVQLCKAIKDTFPRRSQDVKAQVPVKDIGETSEKYITKLQSTKQEFESLSIVALHWFASRTCPKHLTKAQWSKRSTLSSQFFAYFDRRRVEECLYQVWVVLNIHLNFGKPFYYSFIWKLLET